MKTIKLLSFSLFLLISFNVSAQNFQGKAYYASKLNNDMDLSNRDIPEEIKKRIIEQNKSMSSKNYILEFKNDVSLYTEEVKLDQSTNQQGFGGMRRMILSSQDLGNYYKNVSEKKFTNQKDLFGKIFLVKDSLQQFDWKFENDIKTIGNYTCFKATTAIVNYRQKFPFNRNPDEDMAEKMEEQEPEIMLVTAWYTLDIPVKQGPGKFWGLPGLILEVHTENNVLLCTKIELERGKKNTVTEPKKGKVVSQEEYNKILKDKQKELQENFRNRRGPGGRFRSRN